MTPRQILRFHQTLLEQGFSRSQPFNDEIETWVNGFDTVTASWAKKPVSNSENKTAAEYAEEWSGAYSADRCGREVSEAIIKVLLKHFSPRDSERIYRSKHLRWFFDGHKSTDVKKIKKEFANYIFNNGNNVCEDVAYWNINGY